MLHDEAPSKPSLSSVLLTLPRPRREGARTSAAAETAAQALDHERPLPGDTDRERTKRVHQLSCRNSLARAVTQTPQPKPLCPCCAPARRRSALLVQSPETNAETPPQASHRTPPKLRKARTRSLLNPTDLPNHSPSDPASREGGRRTRNAVITGKETDAGEFKENRVPNHPQRIDNLAT
jgi:hypothetical protein